MTRGKTKVSLNQGTKSPCNYGTVGIHTLSSFCAILLLVFTFSTQSSFALQRIDAEDIPHVNQRAIDSFVQYIYAAGNKAFAVAPGGAWAWSDLATTEKDATQKAIEQCQSYTQQTCVLFALNDKVVFDEKKWPTLWRLQKNKPAFPILKFKDKNGKSRSLKDFKNKITLVHFWGSWCPPCLREMPTLLRLQKELKKQYGNKVKMILLQVREPFKQSMQWAKQQGFDKLPLYDSGVKGEFDHKLRTTNGKSISDRQLAKVFPSSYVLDGQGRVLFSHRGPIDNWLEYLPFFKDVLKQTK